MTEILLLLILITIIIVFFAIGDVLLDIKREISRIKDLEIRKIKYKEFKQNNKKNRGQKMLEIVGFIFLMAGIPLILVYNMDKATEVNDDMKWGMCAFLYVGYIIVQILLVDGTLFHW